MNYDVKERRGITLIALVITVIVLLILAGVSINMLTGQNGILNKASDAKKQTESSSDLEYLQTKAYEAITNYYANGKVGSEREYILNELEKENDISTNISNETIQYKNKIYTLNEIIGNSTEQKSIEKAGLEQVTIANVKDSDDKEMLSETDEDGNVKIRMIIVEEITDKGKVKAVIPSGFYYVSGTPTTGLVISDKFEDDDANSKSGNQFVWVPCNGGEATYKKHTYISVKENDTEESVSDTGNGMWRTYLYRNYTDWSDEENRTEKEASVTKYGGFYIARYEAGEPTNADFYNDKDGSIYWQAQYNLDTNEVYGCDNTNKTDLSKKYTNSYKVKNQIKQGTEDLLPTSKKNSPVWNYISQNNSKIVSENMYKQSKTVTSYLIDGYAWDTVIQWMSDKGKSLTDSENYGNYYNSNYTFKGLYARHQGKNSNDGIWRWFPAYIYNYGTYNKENEYVETATGISDRNVVQNIYDLAGNVREWTTETGKHGLTTTEASIYAVQRGGSLYDSSGDRPICHRNGESDIDHVDISIGFRVVLYIK